MTEKNAAFVTAQIWLVGSLITPDFWMKIFMTSVCVVFFAIYLFVDKRS